MPKSFWEVISDYTSELAPVAGPLLSAVSETASALNRAQTSTRLLEADTRRLEPLLTPAEPRPTPRGRSTKRRKA